MIIQKVNPKETDNLRYEYLSSLPFFQEYYLEYQVNGSSYYLFRDENSVAGYAIIAGDNTLLEFHVRDEFVCKSEKFLPKLLGEHGINRIFCKSFDNLLLDRCLEMKLDYSFDGHLFRHSIPAAIYPIGDLSVRPAMKGDIPMLLEQEDELFSDPKEVTVGVTSGTFLLFYKAKYLVGCGFLTRIHPRFKYFDIGMWVHPKYRGMGYATRIISYLKQDCNTNGYIPICGCAMDNAESKRVLEKNGFISKHHLLTFSC